SGAASADVEKQAATFQAQVEQRLKRATRNQALLRALLDVSVPQETSSYATDKAGRVMALAQPSMDEQYAAAFRRWGLDIDRTPEAVVVARLRDELGPVLEEVIGGLDAWMLERRAKRFAQRDWRR